MDRFEAAADWWVAKISNRVWHDNGDESENGAVAGALMGLVASNHPDPDDEQIDHFRELLIGQMKTSWAHTSYGLSISTDYAPDRMLGSAARAAGVPESRFPWKTHMSVNEGYVTVGDGYQAPMRIIWQDPEWVQPPCDAQDTDGAPDYNYLPRRCGKLVFHEGEHGDWTDDPLCWCGRPHRHHPCFDLATRTDHYFSLEKPDA